MIDSVTKEGGVADVVVLGMEEVTDVGFQGREVLLMK